ncbi:hypothetical protein OV203_07180 [Nannocystis sp. ILAH1]|uniref:hypothetical protein n=1 Tax=unclassified Nannocystis TaxID=2627009 RepID=UPI002270C509|nr:MULTISPECIES: hypothetical protein [unclassified Nannocystis]MCY0986897.1 hypothetical protein [Nannocystis sp. ILAH1]MCY1071779.1 hypothetical protein [Nannocystis sp. RBIL2]
MLNLFANIIGLALIAVPPVDANLAADENVVEDDRQLWSEAELEAEDGELSLAPDEDDETVPRGTCLPPSPYRPQRLHCLALCTNSPGAYEYVTGSPKYTTNSQGRYLCAERAERYCDAFGEQLEAICWGRP